jgi:hypothetical protein
MIGHTRGGSKPRRLTLLVLLTHHALLIRIMTGWSIGLLLLFVAWTASSAWLPVGALRFWSRLVGWLPLTLRGMEVGWSQVLVLFTWNLVFGVGLIILASFFTVGRFPLGYLPAWLLCLAYGGLLGTNSFAFPSHSGPEAPNIMLLWTHAGVRELTAYLLVAAALTHLHQWRQRSWWSRQVERIRQWRDIHLSWAEVLCLVVALGLLAWAAYVEVFW